MKMETEQVLVVEGEMYYLSDLAQDPFALELKNKILNTKESFIFTFRGGDPTQIINYLNEHRYANEDS